MDYKMTDHVVYAHSCGGDIIYVGSGNPLRAYTSRGRSDVWRSARHYREVTVVILGVYPTRKAAYEAEAWFIASLQPIANKAGLGPADKAKRDERVRRGRPCVQGKTSRQIVESTPGGRRFPTIREAAKYYGISGAAVTISIQQKRPVYKARQSFSYVFPD